MLQGCLRTELQVSERREIGGIRGAGGGGGLGGGWGAETVVQTRI